MRNRRNKRKSNNTKDYKKILIISGIFIAVLLFSVIFSLINMNSEKIVSGVRIEGIKVSNLTRDESKEKLQNWYKETILQNINLYYEDLEETINLKELDINEDIDKIINDALKIGRSGNILKDNYNILFTMLFHKKLEVNITYDEEKLNQKIEEISKKLPDSVVETNYYIENNELIIKKGTDGVTINKDELKELVKNAVRSDYKNINIPVVEAKIEEIDIEKIHDEIYKEAQDAYITQDPLTVHPNVNGVDFAISLDEAKEILKEDKEEYVIPLKITVADRTISDLGEEAFPNVLGTFTTRYDASNKNRSNNISLASDKINGTVVLPGETFSYNQTVGKRTIDAGYKEAGAYAGGKVIQEVGGGICQVSSTLYNAVLYANLEIVDRSNHYFQTSYVDAGRDATVSWGTVDFKFKNNRQYPIKVEAVSKNGVTKISIKGIKEDTEYEVVIQSEITSIIQKSVKYEEDSSLDSSVEQVEQEGHNGCTSKTYKILKLNGAIVSTEEISTDYYHALEKIIKKGIKQPQIIEPEDDDEINIIENELNGNLIRENIM